MCVYLPFNQTALQMEWIFGETMGFNVFLAKRDSLEEGEPFLVAVARLCNAGYGLMCNCAIV